MVIEEYAVSVALRFLPPACDSAIDATCLDWWISCNGCGVLVPFSSGVHGNVNDSRKPETNLGCSFDSVAFLAPYCRSTKVDWALKELAQRWYLHSFTRGKEHDVPERRLQ